MPFLQLPSGFSASHPEETRLLLAGPAVPGAAHVSLQPWGNHDLRWPRTAPGEGCACRELPFPLRPGAELYRCGSSLSCVQIPRGRKNLAS